MSTRRLPDANGFRRAYAALLPTLAVLCLLLLSACSSPARLAAVPKDQEAAAVVDGMTGIRYWQQGDLPLMTQDSVDAYNREAQLWAAAGHKDPLPPSKFLAISGGGENGAFGAGLLVGWT